MGHKPPMWTVSFNLKFILIKDERNEGEKKTGKEITKNLEDKNIKTFMEKC